MAICQACGRILMDTESQCKNCKIFWEQDIATNNLPPGLEGFDKRSYTLDDYIWLWRYKRKYDQDQYMRNNYMALSKEFTENEMLTEVCKVIVIIKYRALMEWEEAVRHVNEISRDDVKDYLDSNINGRYSFLQSPISF